MNDDLSQRFRQVMTTHRFITVRQEREGENGHRCLRRHTGIKRIISGLDSKSMP